MKNRGNTNSAYWNLSIILTFSEILMDESVNETVRELRFAGLKQLQEQLAFYEKRGYLRSLLEAIAEKKCQMILKTSSKTEMEKVIKPHAPHYDGNKFIPDIYNIPEEEMICWSETSLRAPLNEAGFHRYMEVFLTVFPEKKEQLEALGGM